MFSFCITLIVIFSIFLIILALLQNSKRDNSSGNIIGSMGANQLIGIKETTDILTKMTLFFIFAIFILSIFSFALNSFDSVPCLFRRQLNRRIVEIGLGEHVKISGDDGEFHCALLTS